MSAVQYEKNGKTALLALDRPEAKNAVNGELTQGLAEAFREVEADDEVRCLVLTGNTSHPRFEEAVRALLSAQRADGGWGTLDRDASAYDRLHATWAVTTALASLPSERDGSASG